MGSSSSGFCSRSALFKGRRIDVSDIVKEELALDCDVLSHLHNLHIPRNCAFLHSYPRMRDQACQSDCHRGMQLYEAKKAMVPLLAEGLMPSEELLNMLLAYLSIPGQSQKAWGEDHPCLCKH